MVGWVHFGRTDYSSARAIFEETLEQARRLGNPTLIRSTLPAVCQVLVATGDTDRAEPLAAELADSKHDLTRSSGNHYLADCALYRGEYALARSHYRTTLKLNIDIGRVPQATIEMLGVAYATAGLGRKEQAVRLEGAAAGKREELDLPTRHSGFFEAWRAEFIGPARQALGDATSDAVYSEGKMMDWEAATSLALEGD
jgi:hypothetical protein